MRKTTPASVPEGTVLANVTPSHTGAPLAPARPVRVAMDLVPGTAGHTLPPLNPLTCHAPAWVTQVWSLLSVLRPLRYVPDSRVKLSKLRLVGPPGVPATAVRAVTRPTPLAVIRLPPSS